MKDNVKRVFYVRYVAHPCYLDIIAQRPEIRLDKLENDTADEVARPIMAAAHAYQIGSARDELNPRFHVQRDLLARMPNLLIVSTNGAGFDTVNVKDCTDAGVLVVNQTGGNAEAVATHVLAMVLMLSKQIIQTNHALRRGTMHDRSVFMGNDVKGAFPAEHGCNSLSDGRLAAPVQGNAHEPLYRGVERARLSNSRR
jgi:D-3-phosphoglycerate dehydrogenase / 2-oxoglutarate reductase